MRNRNLVFLSLLVALLALRTAGAQTFTAGKDYVVLPQRQPTSVPAGKVEVLEVFSYGCPVCNIFEPTMERLKKSLPPNAQVAYLPASFIPAEAWPMFQRAYFAAQVLGIAERTHQAMYDAIWKSGELATTDKETHRLKSPQPSIEAAASAYARWTGVKPADFLAAAKSFSVDVRMHAADDQILAMQVRGTPCIVVDGRFRVDDVAPRPPAQVIALVRYLIGLSAH
ncbi:MAG TPA: thiol:disulfide interchange protein DsbA/DsbL [Steroidobacteraceae bacterium]|nr:thiol:disulfide interchange protein DsbA/DsbL [Steroidobacteraceae bacterium]